LIFSSETFSSASKITDVLTAMSTIAQAKLPNFRISIPATNPAEFGGIVACLNYVAV